MKRLDGKVALITGGNSGMGLETARLFVSEGARVVITGRRERELSEAVESIGGPIIGVQGDVANLSDLDSLMKTIQSRFGALDVIFANAGIGELCPISEVTEEHFDRIFDVNVKGLLFTVQKALPLLRDGSSIVLNASIAGFKGMESFSVYSATKAAVRSFARTWATDLKQRRIRVNAISPGPIDTPIFGKMGLTEETSGSFKQALPTLVPLGRMGSSVEVAKAVLFLASDESSYVNGIDLSVDGGMAQV
jgi:NAD(P)-dependent dehydrogenase (short-subunit alcohol dehydrogenase family)